MPTGPEVRPLSHHAQAGLGAGTAGLGALLAMVVWVVLTLIGTGQAHFAAQAAKMRRHFAVARHGIRSQAANGRAIHIEGHAAGHHADIAFFQAGAKQVLQATTQAWHASIHMEYWGNEVGKGLSWFSAGSMEIPL